MQRKLQGFRLVERDSQLESDTALSNSSLTLTDGLTCTVNLPIEQFWRLYRTNAKKTTKNEGLPHVGKVGLAPHIFKVGAALRQQSQIWTSNVIG